VIVALGAAYVLVPTGTALAVQVSADRTTPVSPGREVLYGNATDVGGKPIAGVEIAVEADHGRRRDRVAELHSGLDGTFRREVTLPAGEYTLTVEEPSHGRGRSEGAHVRVYISPGHAYRVSVKERRHGGFAFIPVSSY
jgi:hypothetical protein